MTNSTNYIGQLETSKIALKLRIPKIISQGIADKVALIQKNSAITLPENIIYEESVDILQFYPPTNLGKIKINKWEFEIVKAKKRYIVDEVIIVLIKKVGFIQTTALEQKNINNSEKSKKIQN